MPNFYLFAAGGSNAALFTFLIYTAAVFVIAWASNRLLKSKSFVSEYFLGSRSLGLWAFALTFAATSSSGGSFTGFPAKIYSYGWILGLWIASYMVVPLCAMGLLGKRINQVARISGSITVPDVLRDRMQSVRFGILATVLIVFFMSVNLVAQFKAGSLILGTLLEDVGPFQNASHWLAGLTTNIALFDGIDPSYLLCLFTFGVAVIIYTTYGGFHAVVWTDVMQGVVMVLGVLIMLPLALYAVGGLESATHSMADMTPPLRGMITIQNDTNEKIVVPSGTWLLTDQPADADAETPERMRVLRTGKLTSIIPDHLIPKVPVPEGSKKPKPNTIDVVELTTPDEVDRQIAMMEKEGDSGTLPEGLVLASIDTKPYVRGGGETGYYVTGPGPSLKSMDGFLPFSLAVSFFFMWAISGAGQPASMVRLMAFNSATTFRRSMFTVAFYYTLIYFPLVLIFCCSRVLLPGREAEPDVIMPEMAVLLTSRVGHGWLAGLLIAAPFAAVMSTVDSFLLMISSALVRDVYQRNINPEVSERSIKLMSYGCTLLIGTFAMVGAINPPRFLQDIIVYCGSGLAACFLAPMVYCLYWPRTTSAGAMASMLAGFATHLSLYVAGYLQPEGSFERPYLIWGFNPVVVGLLASFAAGFVVSLMTPPPPEALVKRYFHKRPTPPEKPQG